MEVGECLVGSWRVVGTDINATSGQKLQDRSILLHTFLGILLSNIAQNEYQMVDHWCWCSRATTLRMGLKVDAFHFSVYAKENTWKYNCWKDEDLSRSDTFRTLNFFISFHVTVVPHVLKQSLRIFKFRHVLMLGADKFFNPRYQHLPTVFFGAVDLPVSYCWVFDHERA